MAREPHHYGGIVMSKRYLLFILGLLLLVGIAGAIPAPVPTMPTSAVTSLYNNMWNFAAMLPLVLQPYASYFGVDGMLMVTGFITFVIIIVTWVRTESALIVMIEFVAYGFVVGIPTFVPPDWTNYAILLLVVLPAAGVLYSVYKASR